MQAQQPAAPGLPGSTRPGPKPAGTCPRGTQGDSPGPAASPSDAQLEGRKRAWGWQAAAPCSRARKQRIAALLRAGAGCCLSGGCPEQKRSRRPRSFPQPPFFRGTHVHTFCKQTRVFPKPLELRSNQPAARLLIRLSQKLFLCLRLPLQRNDRLYFFAVYQATSAKGMGGRAAHGKKTVRAGGSRCATQLPSPSPPTGATGREQKAKQWHFNLD